MAGAHIYTCKVFESRYQTPRPRDFLDFSLMYVASVVPRRAETIAMTKGRMVCRVARLIVKVCMVRLLHIQVRYMTTRDHLQQTFPHDVAPYIQRKQSFVSLVGS